MSSDPPEASPSRLRGASAALVRRALDAGDPLPGTSGFAGAVDGRLVRDVLGRELVYSERDDPTAWAFDPDDLADPSLVPAGHVRPCDRNGTGDGSTAADDAWPVGDVTRPVGDDARPAGDDGTDRRVWSLPSPSPTTDERAAVGAVRDAVRESVDAAAGGERADGLAVAFSGGVDSAAAAARLDAPLYVAGFPDSHDIAAARSAAAWLDRDLRVVELSHADLERAVPEVVAATGRTNAMDVSIAVPLYLVAERAAADGYDRLAVGQGADELFGGYAKVARAPDDDRVAAETVRGARREVVGTLPAQFERDLRALRGAGVEPVAPFLADGVVAAALELPGALLVSARGERKHALRRAVRAWVPDPVAFREKKAVQYGSLVSRELDRLARRDGFKRRLDDHVGRYVRSFVSQ